MQVTSAGHGARASASGKPAMRRAKRAHRRRLWPFLVPSALVALFILLYPLAYAFYLSLFNYYLDTGASTFVVQEPFETIMSSRVRAS